MADQWRDALDQILESSHGRDATELMTELRKLAAVMGRSAGDALLDANTRFFDYRPALTQARHEMVVNNELGQIRCLRQSSTSFAKMVNAYLSGIYDRTGDLLDQLDLRNCRCVVVVGCGWIPATLFYFHDRTGIPELIGLDVTADAVATSNELARRLGYTRARTEVQDGGSYDYGRTQIVYIVNMVSSKSAVLSRIADTAPDDVQVIVGEPYSLGRLWSEAVEPTLDPRFEVASRGPERATLSRALLLRRKA